MQNRREKGGTVRGLHTEGDGNSGPKRGLNAAAHPIIPPTDEAHHVQPSFSSIFPTLSLPLSLALFFSLALSFTRPNHLTRSIHGCIHARGFMVLNMTGGDNKNGSARIKKQPRTHTHTLTHRRDDGFGISRVDAYEIV